MSCWCPFPEALAYLGLPLFCCMVESKSAGRWGRTRREHQSLEPFQPLPIFSSSAISRLLGLFQLLGEEEVSGRAPPDDIYFHESREPPPCSMLTPCPSVSCGCGGLVIHHEGGTAGKSWHGIGTGGMAAGGLVGNLARARSVPVLTQLRAIVNIEQEPLKNKAAWTQIPTWNKIKLKETIQSCTELEGELALAFKVVIFAAEGKRRSAVQVSKGWECGPPARGCCLRAHQGP